MYSERMKPESSNWPLPPGLSAWLDEQEQPEFERRALEETWRLAEYGHSALCPLDHERKQEVWEAVSRSMQRCTAGDVPHPRLRIVSRTWPRVTAVAAAIALLIGVAYVLRPIHVEAPRGSFAEALLPDGSKVTLNSDSRLIYRARFLGSRSVELEGEAFFEVAKDDDPFVIETFNARTTVLGTAFNLRARNDEADRATEIIVTSGRVEFSSKTGGSEWAVLLDPGQRSIMVDYGPPTSPVPNAREIAWRTGDLSFMDQSYAVIFAEIERRFDVDISTSAAVAAERFSIHLHKPSSAEEVLSNLSQADGLRYRETANGYEVYRP